MNAPRVVVVTPRYWPLVGPSEYALAELVSQWHQLGARPTVVTPRWDSGWSTTAWHRCVPLVRLASAPRGGWSTARYHRELTQWLRQQRERADVTFVANLREEAAIAVPLMQSVRTPVVLRVEGAGERGDGAWQEASRNGRRLRRHCWRADLIIATTADEQKELCAAGCEERKIVRIDPGVRETPEREAVRRHCARAALAEVNHDLAAADAAPVALCIERLEAGRGLFELVRSWRLIAERWPSAALWIIGDGPSRGKLYETIVAQGLHRQAFLPGSFDDWRDLLQAADLYLAPSADPGFRYATAAALAAGVPTIAVATDDHRAMIDSGVEGLLVPPHEPAAFSAAISRLLEDPVWSTRLGQAARRRLAPQWALPRIAAEYLDQFAKLASGERGAG